MLKLGQLQFDWSAAAEDARPDEPFEQASIRADVLVLRRPEPEGSGRLVSASDFALCFAAVLQFQPETRFDNHSVAEFAREMFGHAAGHAREAYDAAEAGMNIYLGRTGLDHQGVHATIQMLMALEGRMPRQTRRDEFQVELQQFSTPPAEAFLVVTAAALRPARPTSRRGTGRACVRHPT